SLRQQQLRWRQPLDLQGSLGRLCLKAAELARGNVDMREAGQPVFRHIGGEEVVGRSRQQVLLNKSPRRHDPHYLAVDQVAPFWGLHLLADRNLVAPRDQLAEMGIQGVVWYTCQRHALILAHRPRVSVISSSRATVSASSSNVS